MARAIIFIFCFLLVFIFAAISDDDRDKAGVVLHCKSGFRWIFYQRIECFDIECDYISETEEGMEYSFTIEADVEGTYDVHFRYIKEGSNEILIDVKYIFHVNDMMHMDYVGKEVSYEKEWMDIEIPEPIILD